MVAQPKILEGVDELVEESPLKVIFDKLEVWLNGGEGFSRVEDDSAYAKFYFNRRATFIKHDAEGNVILQISVEEPKNGGRFILTFANEIAGIAQDGAQTGNPSAREGAEDKPFEHLFSKIEAVLPANQYPIVEVVGKAREAIADSSSN